MSTTAEILPTASAKPSLPLLNVQALSKQYGQGSFAIKAIERIDFQISQGEFVSIVGPSGAGKTTLLKCLSGLLAPTSGQAELNGARITLPPEAMAFVFQDYSRSLLPWMSVIDNVALPLKSKGTPRDARKKAATEALDAVGLQRFVDKYPWQLSGGMQQRVAIARALAYNPALLLMDEPFASVDAQTRADLEDLILRIHEKLKVTILFVTHDIDEAVYLSDRVIVLSKSPTVVREIVAVPLPRPRDQIVTKELAAYGRLRTHVLQLIRGSEHGTADAV